MEAQLQPEPWPKRRERRDVNISAVASRSDGTKVRVWLINISYEGCQLTTESELAVGERIKLDLAGLGEASAEVRWTSKKRAGARFELERPLLAEKQPATRGSE